MTERLLPVVRTRAGRPRRFRPWLVPALDAESFERYVARQEARNPEQGEALGVLLSLQFYADPYARVLDWRRK